MGPPQSWMPGQSVSDMNGVWPGAGWDRGASTITYSAILRRAPDVQEFVVTERSASHQGSHLGNGILTRHGGSVKGMYHYNPRKR